MSNKRRYPIQLVELKDGILKINFPATAEQHGKNREPIVDKAPTYSLIVLEERLLTTYPTIKFDFVESRHGGDKSHGYINTLTINDQLQQFILLHFLCTNDDFIDHALQENIDHTLAPFTNFMAYRNRLEPIFHASILKHQLSASDEAIAKKILIDIYAIRYLQMKTLLAEGCSAETRKQKIKLPEPLFRFINELDRINDPRYQFEIPKCSVLAARLIAELKKPKTKTFFQSNNKPPFIETYENVLASFNLADPTVQNTLLKEQEPYKAKIEKDLATVPAPKPLKHSDEEVEPVSPLETPAFINLFDKINVLEQYSVELKQQGAKHKANCLHNLATDLNTMVQMFFTQDQATITKEADTFRTDFLNRLHQDDAILIQRRFNLSTVVINIAAALTGILAPFVAYKLMNTGTGFFGQAKTTSMQHVDAIWETYHTYIHRPK